MSKPKITGNSMTTPSLQDGIDEAGSPIKLLWKPNAPGLQVPVLPPEFVGWREEQASWRNSAAFMDQSFHMKQIFVEGLDAKRILSDISVNDYEDFVIGRAKQFVAVTPKGDMISDAIVMRLDAEKYVISGIAAAETWVRYHAQTGGYNVTYLTDPNSGQRLTGPGRGNSGTVAAGGEPVLFRYQVQGPRALELVEHAFDGPLPPIKFFHSVPVSLAGRTFRAFRHGMAGMPGYEFIGEYKDAEVVKEALLGAGKSVGVVPVGGLAYYTGCIESGWLPLTTVGIYTLPEMADYRRYVGLYTYEGQIPLHGSYFSENIEDYYVSPFDLGYGRFVDFKHEFIGRAALEESKDRVHRTKVTLVWNEADVRKVLGENLGYMYTHTRDRLESGPEFVGYSLNAAHICAEGTVLSLALLENKYASPGTELSLAWGEHPGPGTSPDAHQDFPRIRVTVQPAPYNAFSRTQYRRNI
jgi:vanillate/3-O-methylgallate O-demethylase